jgi:hypothetical protein
MSEKKDNTVLPNFNDLSVSNNCTDVESGTRPSVVSAKVSGESEATTTRTKSNSDAGITSEKKPEIINYEGKLYSI